jgi:hypothetical protein
LYTLSLSLPAERLVHGLAAQVRRIDSLERDHLVVQAVGVAHQLKELLDESQHMGFACARRAMQEPRQRFRGLSL